MKIRKSFFFVLMLTLVIVLVSCKKKTEVEDGEIIDLKDLTLAVGMEHKLDYKESDGYTFNITNPYVASIDENGVISAELEGSIEVEILKNATKYARFNLTVMNKIRSINIEGPSIFYTNEISEYKVSFLPRNGYPFYQFSVEDEALLTINEEGVIIPKKTGTTIIRVNSLQDDETFDEIEVTIKKAIIVKANLGTNETITLGNWNYKKGLDLFETISEAVAASNDGDKVLILDGLYDEEVVINKSITLEGQGGVIENSLIVEAPEVVINELKFEKNAQVESVSSLVNRLDFTNNNVENISLNEFMTINNVDEVNIINNTFNELNKAVIFENLGINPKVLIEKNVFINLKEPIEINSLEKIDNNASVRIYRNNINNVDNAFLINLSTENELSIAKLYTRFNQVTNYKKAIIHNGPNIFEHTLNYWGDFNLNNFINVEEKMLIGYYDEASKILRETAYDANVPILVEWENVIDEIWLGETFDIEVTVVPYTSDQKVIQLQIINMELAELVGGKTLTPKTSGEFKFRIGSFANPLEIKEHLIKVTTDPGIHLEIDNPTQNLTIGNRFNINGIPFPYDRVEEPVKYESSNTSIATVTVGGLVEVIAEGEFEITASLVNEPAVKQTIGFKTYDQLDDENILDFYTKRQLAYSQVHHIELHGADSYLRIHNESVTRVLADTIESVEKIIPVSPGFRPGTLMRSNIPEKFKYNDDNVVWVVVHDTGNSNAGAGAEMHGNYLFNAATNGGREASWHYTIDSHLRFQSMPENEIAYHAGDGSGASAVPKEDGESPALGGGNTNGIGIEMSVQRDGDVWKTWQNTAQFSASLLHKYNLPLSHITYHNDFSGKNCPQTLRRAGLIWLFEEFVQNEYDLIKIFGDTIDSVRFVSHNPEILDNTGVIVNTPNQSTNVSYTLEVVINGETLTRTFTTLVEGLWR